MQNYVKIHTCYSKHVNLYRHNSFCIYLFMYPKTKRRKWIVVVVCKEKLTIKKNDILMKYNINK